MNGIEDVSGFPSEEDVQELLDGIPAYVSDVLDLSANTILDAVCRLHGMHAYWATRLAAARARQMASKAAKEVGLAVIRRDKRSDMISRYGRVTDKAVENMAIATVDYIALARAEAEAEMEFLRCKGIVDAIFTKREALRMLSYVLRNEMDIADRHVSVDSYSNDDLYQIAEASSGNFTPNKVSPSGKNLIGIGMGKGRSKVIRKRAK